MSKDWDLKNVFYHMKIIIKIFKKDNLVAQCYSLWPIAVYSQWLAVKMCDNLNLLT